jgi:hypothetical protein
VPANPPAANPSTGVSSQPDQRLKSAADPASVIPSVNQSALPPLQAAQLEHKSEHSPISTPIVTLAGGDKSPQTPLRISPPKATKKRRGKRRDNHLSFRASDEEFDIVAERMARTGESQSDAVRGIIRESQDEAGNIYLAPKTPPEQLEKMLGELGKWRMAFSTARPRLNMATPASDDERYSQVIAWRKEADRLLAEIPQLEMAVNVALAALTNLTPERVARLRKGIRSLNSWKQAFEKEGKQHLADFCQDLIDILEDAGISSPK